MNARWTILLAVCMAVVLAAQVGFAAVAAPPASGQSQLGQTQQATMVRATLVSSRSLPAVAAATTVSVLRATTVRQRGAVVVAAR